MTSEVENILNGQVVRKVNADKAIGVAQKHLVPNEKGIVPLSNQSAFIIETNTIPTEGVQENIANLMEEEPLEKIDLVTPQEGVIQDSPIDVEPPTSLTEFNLGNITLPNQEEEEVNALDAATQEVEAEEKAVLEMPTMPEEILAQAPTEVDNALFADQTVTTPVETPVETTPVETPVETPVAPTETVMPEVETPVAPVMETPVIPETEVPVEPALEEAVAPVEETTVVPPVEMPIETPMEEIVNEPVASQVEETIVPMEEETPTFENPLEQINEPTEPVAAPIEPEGVVADTPFVAPTEEASNVVIEPMVAVEEPAPEVVEETVAEEPVEETVAPIDETIAMPIEEAPVTEMVDPINDFLDNVAPAQVEEPTYPAVEEEVKEEPIEELGTTSNKFIQEEEIEDLTPEVEESLAKPTDYAKLLDELKEEINKTIDAFKSRLENAQTKEETTEETIAPVEETAKAELPQTEVPVEAEDLIPSKEEVPADLTAVPNMFDESDLTPVDDTPIQGGKFI